MQRLRIQGLTSYHTAVLVALRTSKVTKCQGSQAISGAVMSVRQRSMSDPFTPPPDWYDPPDEEEDDDEYDQKERFGYRNEEE